MKNPAGDQINISYTLIADTQVKLEIVDKSGEIVEILNDGKIPSHKGKYSINMRSRNLQFGTYLIRLSTNKGIETSRIVILR